MLSFCISIASLLNKCLQMIGCHKSRKHECDLMEVQKVVIVTEVFGDPISSNYWINVATAKFHQLPPMA